MTRRFLAGALGLGLACTLPLAACGDDDEASDEYCDIARELSAQDDAPPDDPIFDRYLEAAPDEIRDDAALALERIGEEGDEAFNDPEVLEAVENIEAFEEEECGITLDDRTDEDDGDDSDETTTTVEDLTGTTEDTADEPIDDVTGTTEDTTEDSIDDLTTPTN